MIYIKSSFFPLSTLPCHYPGLHFISLAGKALWVSKGRWWLPFASEGFFPVCCLNPLDSPLATKLLSIIEQNLKFLVFSSKRLTWKLIFKVSYLSKKYHATKESKKDGKNSENVIYWLIVSTASFPVLLLELSIIIMSE